MSNSLLRFTSSDNFFPNVPQLSKIKYPYSYQLLPFAKNKQTKLVFQYLILVYDAIINWKLCTNVFLPFFFCIYSQSKNLANSTAEIIFKRKWGMAEGRKISKSDKEINLTMHATCSIPHLKISWLQFVFIMF